MRSLFKKFKEGLKRQTPTFHQAFENVFLGAKLDSAALDQLEETLFSADFGVDTVEEVIEEIQTAYKSDKKIRSESAADIGASVLARVLEGAEGEISVGQHRPEVICLIGVNGSGKTTTTAKLAHLYQKSGHKPLIGACDTFRAAANEQIKHWAETLQVDIVSSHHGADSSAVAFDTCEAAKKRGHDIVLLDTAGRLHTKSNLMKELEKLRRVLQKQDASAPHHSWLVVDGSLGSNSIETGACL